MKKLAILVIVLTMLVFSTSFVSAESEVKTVPVVLTDIPSTVTPGEAVIIEAVSQKKGSSYNIVWSNATEGQTVYNEETGCYTSEAVFQANTPGIYTVSFEITMFAGTSNTMFVGRVEKTIEVTGIVTLIGADIRDLIVSPVFNSDGSISYYKASGNIYSIWSDGTSVLYGSIFFNFGVDMTSKTINVTIYENGIPYIYTVIVNR